MFAREFSAYHDGILFIQFILDNFCVSAILGYSILPIEEVSQCLYMNIIAINARRGSKKSSVFPKLI